tara:strand:+ start:56236 stop:57537 length:1302 start_codon:yes stop_codon:yes gene_type:complete
MRQKISIGLLTVPLFVAALLASALVYSQQYNGPPIRADGFGYYAFVTTVFVDRDMSFKTAIDQIGPGSRHGEKIKPFGLGRDNVSGKIFNKYTPGTAVLESPFFLLAAGAAHLFGYEQDGYSKPFQVANVISGAFYLSAGVALLFLFLQGAGLGKLATVEVIILLVFATNVFHYATYDASFSHIYSFFAVALLVYLTQRYRQSKQPSIGLATLIGFVLGLVILIRIPNAILGLLPLGVLLERRRLGLVIQHGAAAALIAVVVLSPMLVWWHSVTGQWIVNSYAVTENEGFTHWKSPYVLSFLFSVERGLFFWAPVLFVAFCGLVPLVRKDRLWGWLTVAILTLQIYLCSSWWVWHFGGSFGSRPFVDTTPLLALPLALAIKGIRQHIGRWILVPMAALIFVECCLMYGYWRHFIPYSGTTTAILKALPGKLGS